jgi:hypothetical protein
MNYRMYGVHAQSIKMNSQIPFIIQSIYSHFQLATPQITNRK